MTDDAFSNIITMYQYEYYSEVTHTDRQKYMAELGKLLTFMFKEDRAEILAHYNELFDNAEDEEALMREFGSPTKLAVSISRSYDREDRKLTVSADEKRDAQTKPIASPAPQQPVVEKPKEKSNEEFTGTYAEIVEEFRRQRAIEEGTEYTPIFFDEPQAEEPEAVEEAEAAEAAVPEQEAESEAPTEETGDSAEPTEEVPEVAETPEEAPSEAEAPAAESEPTEEAESEDESSEEVPEESPEEGDAVPEEPAETEEAAAEEAVEEAEAVEEEPETAEESAPVAVKKTNIPLLILYVILAVPVGIVGIVLTVIVGAVVIVCAAVAAAVGIKMFAFAFSGVLSLLADIFMAGGFALIAVALAVLLLWLGVWCIAAGVPGIVSGLRSLGRSLCVKEVYVNG